MYEEGGSSDFQAFDFAIILKDKVHAFAWTLDTLTKYLGTEVKRESLYLISRQILKPAYYL